MSRSKDPPQAKNNLAANSPQPSPQSPHGSYANKCEALAEDNLLRRLPSYQTGKIDFSHNDYLGLSRHPKIIQAAAQAVEKWGGGATASRLLAGNLPLFTDFEQQIAKSKNQAAALIFPSGHQANASVIASLLDSKVLGDEPRVFADRLNHSSIHQGCFAAAAHQHRYQHLDLDHLETLLKKFSDCPRPKFILTETVFGMDGDVADVARIGELAKTHGAFLYLDEAHATGVTGQNGYGLSSLAPNADLILGTFSKAIGAAGAYVACSESTQTYLINRCSGFIYSTAPAPAAIAAAQAAWNLIPTMSHLRDTLKTTSAQVRRDLNQMGYKTGNSTTNIIPVMIGDTQQTMDIKNDLAERGIVVSAIRPPTVPPNTARLRIAICSNHSESDICELLGALADCVELRTSTS